MNNVECDDDDNNKMHSETQTSPPVPPSWRTLPHNVAWPPIGAATWWTQRNMLVVFDCGLFGPLYENMTSSTKPEVRNLLHYVRGGSCLRHWWNVQKIWWNLDVWFLRYSSRQTDKKKYADNTLITILRTPSGGGRGKVTILILLT